MVALNCGLFFSCEAWLGLSEVEVLVPVEMQRCLDVVKFLLQATWSHVLKSGRIKVLRTADLKRG